MKHLIFYLLIATTISAIPFSYAQSPQRGLSVTSNQNAAGPWGAYHALIIGINDYMEWPRLQTAVKDATVIRDTLVTRYGFDRKNVILRTDREASRNQINRDLRYLATAMGPKDNMLVYYAGHGQLDDLTGDGYWVPAEGKLKDPSTWVSNAYIKAVLSSEKVQAKNVVVIADSCYSGSMLRGGPSLMSLDDRRYRQKLAKKAALRSRQVISSGGIEPVADGGAEGHSLFAYYFIDALRKNNKEVIDLENLFHTKVWKPVSEIGDQRPNVGRLKTPMDQNGQFVLLNAAWVKEQAAKNAALEAKKQEQARKASVAEAELAMQRQRFEIEKQKLALEKEQLAQQKSLELERLKFEKQKQEFEYAKLQARLQEMEARRQEGVKASSQEKLRASVGKSTGIVTRSALPSYRIAIFPSDTTRNSEIWSHSAHEVVFQSAIQAIKKFIHKQPEVTLKYSYYKGYSLENQNYIQSIGVETNDKMFDKNNLNKLWVKKSILASYEPDVAIVTKFAKTVKADMILMYQYGWEENTITTAPIYVYLVDAEKAIVYNASEIGTLDESAVIIEKLTSRLLKDFLEKHSGV